MSVEFPGEKYNKSAGFGAKKTPTMVRWIMKTGLVKDKTQANIALMVIAVLFFGITWWLIAGGNSPAQQTTYLEDIPADVRTTLPPEILETIPSRN